MTAGGKGILATLTDWEPAALAQILGHFGKTQQYLSDVAVFRRVYDAFAIAKTLGCSLSTVLQATTNNPDPASSPTSHVVRDFQSALRARYDEASWLQTIKPINDALRSARRDALVAFVLRSLRRSTNGIIDTADKLFEYFLMDVEMDPCMETSRIRHALSSVQLFVDRCLMNLEPRVAPSALNAKQWDWMRRYRVWEANRKIFLWPENWLDPELRDDQSIFFKEAMSELLQSDITEDTASVAMLNYLAKVEDVAKLEPCGMYRDDEANTTHVISRLEGARRKYFYRRREGLTWTPWEEIKLEIEDNPVLPVVWNGRLLLFWVRFIKKTPTEARLPGDGQKDPKDMTHDDIKSSAPQLTVHTVLCWSEYYNGKWQATKTSDVDSNAAVQLGDNVASYVQEGFNRSSLRLGVSLEGDALRIVVSDQTWIGSGDIDATWTTFLFYNTHSAPAREEDDNADQYFTDVGNGRTLDTATDGLVISYYFPNYDQFSGEYGAPPSTGRILNSLLPSKTTTIEPLQTLYRYDAPFFYADRRHAYFVTQTASPITIGGIFNIYELPSLYEAYYPLAKKINVQTLPAIANRPPDPATSEKRPAPDVNIKHSLLGTMTVPYGNRIIGAIGSASPAPRQG
jgi:hypothetical protein